MNRGNPRSFAPVALWLLAVWLGGGSDVLAGGVVSVEKPTARTAHSLMHLVAQHDVRFQSFKFMQQALSAWSRGDKERAFELAQNAASLVSVFGSASVFMDVPPTFNITAEDVRKLVVAARDYISSGNSNDGENSIWEAWGLLQPSLINAISETERIRTSEEIELDVRRERYRVEQIGESAILLIPPVQSIIGSEQANVLSSWAHPLLSYDLTAFERLLANANDFWGR